LAAPLYYEDLAVGQAFGTGTFLVEPDMITAFAAVLAPQPDADLISFGRPFISNPDLVERFRNDWPLADAAPTSDWSAPTGAKGYTDFPVHAPK
jgi:2,4-dienoyl-CoA reductase-like NADH-dependent reductase (Old Yellow Enzyme family)